MNRTPFGSALLAGAAILFPGVSPAAETRTFHEPRPQSHLIEQHAPGQRGPRLQATPGTRIELRQQTRTGVTLDATPPPASPSAAPPPGSPEQPPAHQDTFASTYRQTLEQQDPQALLELARRNPGRFDCAHIDRAWQAAKAEAALGLPAEAFARLGQLLERCSRSEDRLTTLYRAKETLQPEMLPPLLEIEARRQPDPATGTRFRTLRLDIARTLAQAAIDQGQTGEAQSLLQARIAWILESRDADAARLLGLALRARNNPPEAEIWLRRTAQWSGLDSDRLLLGWFLLDLGQYDAAAEQIAMLPKDDPHRIELEDARLRRLASRAYEGNRAHEALESLHGLRNPQRDDTVLEAWSLHRLGRHEEAWHRFVALYREEPASAIAQGVIFNGLQAGHAGRLARLAKDTTGPLATLTGQPGVLDILSADLPANHLPLRVEKDGMLRADPDRIFTKSAGGGMAMRDKRGAAGLDRLTVTQMPMADFRLALTPLAALDIEVRQVTLDSGAASSNALLGHQPDQPARYPTFTRLEQATEPLLTCRWIGRMDGELSLGMTPGNAPLGSTPYGRFALADWSADEGWRVALFRAPVRQSMLSYVGSIDPATNAAWGRVTDNGFKIDGAIAVDKGWMANGSLGISRLTGSEVRTNHRIEAYGALTRGAFATSGTQVRIGPEIFFQYHDRNLSHFTWGHGGYFSPRMLGRLSLLGALETNLFDMPLRLRAGLGYQTQNEAAAPLYPLAPDGREYAASSSQGLAATLELAGQRRLNAQGWAIEFALREQASPAYNEFAGLLRIRYDFGHSTSGRAFLSWLENAGLY